jgi:glycerol-3-phosphate dehydrogenase
MAKGGVDGRAVSRGFVLLDHEDEGVENFVTISGGKLTTYRYMAEKTADLVCRKMGVTADCQTRTQPLPSTGSGRWTEPGRAPRTWLKDHDPTDLLLCECEMVPKSVVDAIVDGIYGQNGHPDLNTVGLRSRIGKGPCQGTFCGPRTLSYLYDKGDIQKGYCIDGLKQFLNRRWRGQHPTLWGRQLVQAELLEAMHCGMFGLELV